MADDMNRTQEQRDFAKRRYDQMRDDLDRRDLSNTEAYDRAIFAVSSTFLALSVAGFKTLVEPAEAECLWMMYTSWMLLALIIPLSLFAFLVGNKALAIRRQAARRYYIDEEDEALEEPNIYERVNSIMNLAAGIGLSLAVLISVIFIILNVREQAAIVTQDKSTPSGINDIRSANVPAMDKVPTRPNPGGSANVPTLESVPAPKPPPPAEK